MSKESGIHKEKREPKPGTVAFSPSSQSQNQNSSQDQNSSQNRNNIANEEDSEKETEISKTENQAVSDDSNQSKDQDTSRESIRTPNTGDEENDEDNVSRKSIKRDRSTYSLQQEVNAFLDNRDSEAYQYYPGVERLDYNIDDERNSQSCTTVVESIAHFTKGSLGIGVLSMHEAYMYGGIWASLVGTFVIGVISSYCSYLLVKSAQSMYRKIRVSQLSYADLAEVAAATGPLVFMKSHPKKFRHTVDFCLFFELSGTCCIYQIVVATTLKQILDLNKYINDIRLFILLSIPVLLPLCMIRSLKILAPFSMVADVFIAVCVLTTQYYSIQKVRNISERPAWKSLHGFTKFIGICLYCLCGVNVALPVENNMRRPARFRFVLLISTCIVMICVAITGFFGYWAWGEECTSPITMHMPRNLFTITLQVLLVIMLSVTFALEFYVPFLIIWHYIAKKLRRSNRVWDRPFKCAYFSCITGVSIAFPNLIPVMSFMGHFSLGIIAIALPAFIDFLVTYHDDCSNHVRWRCIKNIFLVVLGVVCSLSVFYPILG